MPYLILLLFLGAVTLVIYAFLPDERASKEKREPKALKPLQDVQESLVLDLKEQVNSLKSELENLKAEGETLKNELGVALNRESALKEELTKIKQWDDKDKSEFEKLKKDNAQLKEDLINKEEEREKEFAKGLNLEKDLKEKIGALEILVKENKEMTDKIRALEAKIAAYDQELQKQARVFLEIKNKEAQTEWVSKDEYNELKKKLEAAEELLRKIHGAG